MSTRTRIDGELALACVERLQDVVRRFLFSAFVKVHVAIYRASGGRFAGQLRNGELAAPTRRIVDAPQGLRAGPPATS